MQQKRIQSIASSAIASDQNFAKGRDAGEIAARLGETGDQPESDRVAAGVEHDRSKAINRSLTGAQVEHIIHADGAECSITLPLQ